MTAGKLEKTIQEAIQDVIGSQEAYAELQAEHLGECARYGDSWPGAVLDLELASRSVETSIARLRHLEETERLFYGV